ncbi:DUF551 domain-containing protein [Escherichia coli]|uniref:DUF551 domain-containing protein n=1 Tax=Escherichia coli TaxID=562 RepID=UPI001CD9E493|nr:DUF551 domain-containing protein [Escherichia coli]MCA2172248.1 DUF551 domain-containing protein [Escherichia coli]
MTTNHPAHGPVSLDRLHQISEILSKAAAQSDGGNLGYAMTDAVKVIDGAIAAFGAEPVEFLPDNLDRALTILGVALPISKEEFNLDAERWMQRLINRVIRLESELIPPSPEAMKDHQIRELVNDLRDIAIEYHGTQQLRERIARTVRDAMLQAGNSPVTPDGWIPVSERMPDKLIPVTVAYADGEMWSAMWTGEKWNDGTEYPDPHAVTHWREMPAAPQQEGK